MFCALLTPRYQVSVYRTIGPLVLYPLFTKVDGYEVKFKGMTFGQAFEVDALRKWAEMVMGRNDPEP